MHAAFERYKHFLHGHTIFGKHGADEFEHDRWAAYYGEGVVDERVISALDDFFQYFCDEANRAGPVRISFLHDNVEIDVVLFPYVVLILKQEPGRVFRAVNDVDEFELAPVFLYMRDRSTERGEAQASGNEQDMTAVHLFHREACTEGAANAYMHAAFGAGEKPGEITCGADAELDILVIAR